MSVIPKPAVDATKVAQILHLVKENQLLTAALVFILWQAGAIASAASAVSGVCG